MDGADEELLDALASLMREHGGDWIPEDGVIRHQSMTISPLVVEKEVVAGEHVQVHVHFGFQLVAHADPVWDCAVGIGATEALATENLARSWALSTGAGLVELLRQDGVKATRLRPDDPLGFPGWHIICCPIVVLGVTDVRKQITEWIAEHAPLTHISATLKSKLTSGAHGLKIILSDFGEYFVAMELDGDPDGCQEAEDKLRDLKPPALTSEYMCRIYYILLFPETSFPGMG